MYRKYQLIGNKMTDYIAETLINKDEMLKLTDVSVMKPYLLIFEKHLKNGQELWQRVLTDLKR